MNLITPLTPGSLGTAIKSGLRCGVTLMSEGLCRSKAGRNEEIFHASQQRNLSEFYGIYTRQNAGQSRRLASQGHF